MKNNTQRMKNAEWTVPTDEKGQVTFEAAHLAVLMDIRDEMKENNRKLSSLEYRFGKIFEKIDRRLAKNLPLQTRKNK